MSSPAASIRSQRSVKKPVSYAIPKAYITDSDNSDNNSNDENQQQQQSSNGNKGKKKKSLVPSDDDDVVETDVSEYDQSEEDNKKMNERRIEKGKGKASSSDDDEDDDDEEADPTSDSDSGDNDDDDDDDSDMDSLASDTGSLPDKKNKNAKGKKQLQSSNSRKNSSSISRPNPRANPLKLAPNLAGTPTFSRNTSGKTNVKRVVPRSRVRNPVGVGYFDQFSLPFFPPTRKFKRHAEYFSNAEIITEEPLDQSGRDDLYNSWCDFPFGPDTARAQDIGWFKGKWDEENNKVNDKWGGWYSNLKPKPIVRIKEANVQPYLPKNVYPCVPGILTTVEKMKLDEEDAEPLASQMEVDSTQVGEESSSNTDGPIQIWVGDVISEDTPQNLLSLNRFDSHKLDTILPTKPGSILNAGGPVSGVAWCPGVNNVEDQAFDFLAVSTLSSSVPLYHSPDPKPSMIQIWSLDSSVPRDLSPETNPEAGGSGMKFELGLCIDIGEALDLKWCPKGGDQVIDKTETSLGVLAGVFTDGSVSLFLVPDPRIVRKKEKCAEDTKLYIKSTPILRLSAEDTSCSCISWGSHERLIAGCLDGSVLVWNVGKALNSHSPTARPTHRFRAHFSAIRAITFVLAPPHSDKQDGTLDLDGEPTSFVTGSYDGSTVLHDLKDQANKVLLSQDRGITYVAAYDQYTGSIQSNEAESRTRAFFLQPGSIANIKKLVTAQGPILSIATSPHHPYGATTSADGSLVLGNSIRPLRNKSHTAHYHQKLYRFDLNRRTGEYRMLDNLLPEERKALDNGSRGRKKGADEDNEGANSGAWPAALAVISSNWHPDLNRACLLASGVSCGIVRVDWIERA